MRIFIFLFSLLFSFSALSAGNCPDAFTSGDFLQIRKAVNSDCDLFCTQSVSGTPQEDAALCTKEVVSGSSFSCTCYTSFDPCLDGETWNQQEMQCEPDIDCGSLVWDGELQMCREDCGLGVDFDPITHMCDDAPADECPEGMSGTSPICLPTVDPPQECPSDWQSGTLNGSPVCMPEDHNSECDEGGFYGTFNGVEGCHYPEPNIEGSDGAGDSGDNPDSPGDSGDGSDSPDTPDDGSGDSGDSPDSPGDGSGDSGDDGSGDTPDDGSEGNQKGDGAGDCDPTSIDYLYCLEQVETVEDDEASIIIGSLNDAVDQNLQELENNFTDFLGDADSNKLGADPSGFKSAVTDLIPSHSSCIPMKQVFNGHFTMDISCDRINQFKDYFGWFLYLSTAIYLFFFITKPLGEQ